MWGVAEWLVGCVDWLVGARNVGTRDIVEVTVSSCHKVRARVTRVRAGVTRDEKTLAHIEEWGSSKNS